MDWGTVIPAAVAGAVGVAGIGGTLLSARMTGKSNADILRTSIIAEDARARNAEKRAVYAKFLAAINEMIQVRARMDTYKANDPKGEIPRDVDEQSALTFVSAMSANAELELISPAEVREPARELLDIIARNRPGYGDARMQLMIAMRTDLGEPTDGAYKLTHSANPRRKRLIVSSAERMHHACADYKYNNNRR